MVERIAQADADKDPILSLEHEHRYAWAARAASGLVLDAACGTSRLRRHLRAGACVTGYVGLDYDLKAFADQNEEVATFPELGAVAVLSALPLRSGDIDTAVTLETLEHVPDPAAAIAELARVLRPGGLLIGSVPHADKEAYETALYGPNPFHLHRLDEEALDHLLRQHFPHRRFGDAALEVVSTIDARNDPESVSSCRLVTEAGGAQFKGGSLLFAASDDPDAVTRAMGRGLDQGRGHPYVVTVGALYAQARDRQQAADRLVVERLDYSRRLEAELAALRALPSGPYPTRTAVTFVFGNHGGAHQRILDALLAAAPDATLASAGHEGLFDGAGLRPSRELAVAFDAIPGPIILDAPLDLWRMADYAGALLDVCILTVITHPDVTVRHLREWLSADSISASIGANLRRSTNPDDDLMHWGVPERRLALAAELATLLEAAHTPEDILAVYWFFGARQYQVQALSRFRACSLVLTDGEALRTVDGSALDVDLGAESRRPVRGGVALDGVNEQIASKCLQLWELLKELS